MKTRQVITWAIVGAAITLASIILDTARVAAQDDDDLYRRLGVNVFHQRPASFDLPALRAGRYVDG